MDTEHTLEALRARLQATEGAHSMTLQRETIEAAVAAIERVQEAGKLIVSVHQEEILKLAAERDEARAEIEQLKNHPKE